MVLVGHDGPHHLNIADRKPVLRSLKKYHGKPGSGASVEFNIRKGPITMLGIGVKADGKFKFVLAEGESLEGPIPPTGNTNMHDTMGHFPSFNTQKELCIDLNNGDADQRRRTASLVFRPRRTRTVKANFLKRISKEPARPTGITEML